MRLHLLGSPKALLSNGQQAKISSDSERALLAYLAVEKHKTHRRESLSTLLWPETEAKQARSNLRVTLHRLRQALGDEQEIIIHPSKQELQINSEAGIWLDVDVFVSLLDDVENHAHNNLNKCQDCAANLEIAVDLYRGDFLQGLVVDSYTFQEWTIFKQEGLQRKMMGGLHQLTEIYTYQQEYDRAERHARQQLELEPWQESAHRQLMCILALHGERTAALAQYELCGQILAREFEAEPSLETRALFEEIRSGRFQKNEILEQMEPTKKTIQVATPAMLGIASTVWKRLLLVAVLVLGLVGAGSVILSSGFLSGQKDSVSVPDQDVYDDFSNVNFDGVYDIGKWAERHEPEAICELVQQEGVLRISHGMPQLQSGCTLRIKQPLAVAGGDLGSLSARLQLLDTHNGGSIGTVLRITTQLQEGGWAAACGILADFNSTHVLFDIVDLRLGEKREDHVLYSVQQTIDYNTWYKISLHFDENSEHINCLLDGQVIGEFELPNSEELATAQMNREIGVWHEADAEATILVDDVIIGREH